MHNNTNDLIYNWDLTTDYGYEKMVNDIDMFEDNSSTVIDTGASMLYRLNENSSFLSYIKENGDFNINIIFIVGSLKDSSVSARLFIKSFMNYKNIKPSFLLVASTAAESAERSFDFEYQEDIQRAMVELKIKKYFLEYVQQNYFDLIMKQFMLPCKIISNKEIPLGTRSKFNLWLKMKSDPLFQDIVAGESAVQNQ